MKLCSVAGCEGEQYSEREQKRGSSIERRSCHHWLLCGGFSGEEKRRKLRENDEEDEGRGKSSLVVKIRGGTSAPEKEREGGGVY